MAEEKNMLKQPHNVILENRHTLSISGVQDVDSYDEQSVVAFSELGELTIKGENLHINKIDVQTGELSIEGDILEMRYSEHQTSKGGWVSRIFR